MLPRRALLPLLAALAAVLPGAAAHAADVRPVLNGGQLTYEGTAFGKVDIDDTDYRHHETANLAWSTTYVLPAPYPGSPMLQGDREDFEPISWMSNMGDFSGTTSTRYKDPKTGEYKWTPSNLCTAQAESTLKPPNPLPPWEGGAAGPWKIAVYGTQGADWSGSCADPDGAGSDAPLIANDLQAAIPATWTQPKTMKIGAASVSKDVTGGYPTRPCDWSKGCTESTSAQGTMTLRCLLCVTKIDFEHPDQPTGNMVTVPAAGTTEGNLVKVRVQITNKGDKAYTSGVALREAASGRILYSVDWANMSSITFPAGQTKTLVYYVNTDGFAWEKGQPRSDRVIQVLTGAGGGEADLKVLPKPMILVHGWNADAATWDDIKPQVPSLVHPQLKDRVFAVGDGLAIGSMNTDPENGWPLERNARALKNYVQDVRDDLNAANVDLVAHSMGGLISRMYVQEQMPDPTPTEVTPMVAWPVARHLVMIGTPNEGSPCAYLITAVAKGTPSWELRPDYAAGFNKSIKNRRGVQMSVMAGDWEERTCQSPEHGDLVVEVPSAWSTFDDVAKTYINHLDMTGDAGIMGGWVRDHVGKDPDQALNGSQRLPAAGESPARSAALAKGRAAAARGALVDDLAESGDATARGSAAAPVEQQLALATDVTVPAGGSIDVALPSAPSDGALTVGFLAGANVASALVRPDGTVADSVAAGSDAARQPMRFHRAEHPAAGTWKLRLSQSGGAATTAHVAAALENSPLRLTATATDGKLSAGFPDGATLTATLRASEQPDRVLTLAAKGGGAYEAPLVDLPQGEWMVTVEARLGSDLRLATAMVGVAPAGSGGGDGGGNGGGSGNGGGDGGSDGGGSGSGSGGSGGSGSGGGTTGGASSGQTGGGAKGGASGAAGGGTKRGDSAKLTASAAPARDRRAPYAFTIRGRLSGASCAKAKVTLTLDGRRTTVKTDKKCAFSATVKTKQRGKRTVDVAANGAKAKVAVRAG